MTIVPITPSLFDKALQLYERSSDKAWSLTDCASFVVMRERKIIDALSFDHHFEQAGFRALLRDTI
jgi:predicted nucleic acid-binding protein